MNSEVLINISNILERDNKTSTYKFALLRGVIDLIQESSPFIRHEGKRVYFPMGLLINKWIFYYYPLLSDLNTIPQINSAKGLAFKNELKAIIDIYQDSGEGMSVLYHDIKTGRMDAAYNRPIRNLYSKINRTIAGMPMKHIGYSIYKRHYSIFQFHAETTRSPQSFSNPFIQGFGVFSIPVDYFDAFKLLGSFISGRDSILSKWADFSLSSSSSKHLNRSEIISRLLIEPITDRDVKESKQYFSNLISQSGKIQCVWSGKDLQQFDVDHVLPFSIWRNNDLWNLLPSSKKINNQKRDRIPTPSMIQDCRVRIIDNWNLLYSKNQSRFTNEIEAGLLGHPVATGWQKEALSKLQENAEYLIKKRGYEEWKI